MSILSWLVNLFSRKKEIEVNEPTLFAGISPGTPTGGISELPIADTATTDIFSELRNLRDELTVLNTKTSSALKEVEKQKEEVKEAIYIARESRSYVFYGFVALLIFVIGIAIGYWQFIYTASKNDDYRYNMSEKIFKNTADISKAMNDLKELKNCLILGGWKYCLSE